MSEMSHTTWARLPNGEIVWILVNGDGWAKVALADRSVLTVDSSMIIPVPGEAVYSWINADGGFEWRTNND